VRPDKFELPTYRFEVSHSIQLSFAGTRDQEIDLLFRRVIVRDVGSAGREIDGSQCCSKSGNLREGSGANGHIEGRRFPDAPKKVGFGTGTEPLSDTALARSGSCATA
jgi:hypothetical protein